MSLIRRSFWKRIVAGMKKKRESAVLLPRTPDQDKRALESRVAVDKSRELLEKVEQQEPQVARLHESMRRLNDENGFAALILRSMKGRPT